MFPKVIYIAGATRSGTTLADIIIGNQTGFLSGGELMYFTKNGLLENEFCSCGCRVNQCPFWNEVAQVWGGKRLLSVKDYNRIYFSTFKNRSIFRFLFKFIFPDQEFKNFQKDTLSLYQIIWSLGGKKIIVDSSKSPYRLFLLRKLGIDIEVVHIIRNVRGVIFSALKSIQIDAPSGIEMDILPKSPLKVALKWVATNMLVGVFSYGLKRTKVTFERMLSCPEEFINNISRDAVIDNEALKHGGPFLPGHLVAGGRIRMKNQVFIDKSVFENEVWYGTGWANWLVSIIERISWK
jgi:hypothetical protein